MSEPADNPYQSPRGVEASITEEGANKQPLWVRCLKFVAGSLLGITGFIVIYWAIIVVAALGIEYVGRGWTVLGFAAFGTSAILLVVVADKIRKRLKRDDR